MNNAEESNQPVDANQNSNGWGYRLVCSQLNKKSSDGSVERDDLRSLFDYASDIETCFLEFKATPFMPSAEKSSANPHGYEKDEHEDDYAWNVVKSIIAMANTVGGAVILGITNEGHKPIPDICKKYWAGDRWDEFSRNFFDQIFRKSYEVVIDSDSSPLQKGENRQSRTITLNDNARSMLEQLCDPRKCYFQGHTLPVILVKAIQDDNNRICIKEHEEGKDEADVLLVREKCDVGQNKKLKLADVIIYRRPDESSYTLSHKASAPRPKQFWSNLPSIQDMQNIVGRNDDLEHLKNAFTRTTNIQWIRGDLGVGKSAFIQKFIDKYCREDSVSIFDAVFFLSAQGQTFAQAVCQLYSHACAFESFCGIRLNENQGNPDDAIVNPPAGTKPRLFKFSARKLIERLNTYQGPREILIVFDNVDDPAFLNEDHLSPIIKAALNGRVRFCITSRALPSEDERVSVLQLAPIGEEDALFILDRRRSIQGEREIAKEITKLVNCNAWALNLIATQVENDPESDPYTRKLAELKKLGISSALKGKNSGTDFTALYGKSISRLRDKSICGDKAISLFALSAWFPQDAIPSDWLKMAFTNYLRHTQVSPSPCDFESEWESNINILIREGILKYCPGSNTYKAHLLGQDAAWKQPETYQVWEHVFEIVQNELINTNANDSDFLSRKYACLLNFVDLTVTRHTPANPVQDEIAKEAVKKIGSEPKLKKILRKAVENFGNVETIQRICSNLLLVADNDYNCRQLTSESAKRYRFFLSIQKIIAANWKQNIKEFRDVSQKIRIVFERIPQKTEEDEIEFAETLISDAKQYDKLYHYAVIKKDLDAALKIILRYKDKHLKLLIKSYLERTKIELEFNKYHMVRKCLKELINITRKVKNHLPGEDIRRSCKEQLAYMYLCKSQSSSGLRMRFATGKALGRYTKLIAELKCSPIGEPKSQITPRKLLLFKSYYFKAITHLQRKELDKAETELENALQQCNEIFGHNADSDKKTAVQQEFDYYRIKSGILRLQGKFDEAQEADRKAFSLFYKSDPTRDPNLNLADLEDDYGNTYATIGEYRKAIEHVKSALKTRVELLPPTHAKIFNSYIRLAYLHGISAMKSGETAREIIERLIDERSQDEDNEKLHSSSEPLLRQLNEIVKFKNQSKDTFLEQLRKDEQKEECERVRTLVSQLQEKLFELWFADKR